MSTRNQLQSPRPGSANKNNVDVDTNYDNYTRCVDMIWNSHVLHVSPDMLSRYFNHYTCDSLCSFIYKFVHYSWLHCMNLIKDGEVKNDITLTMMGLRMPSLGLLIFMGLVWIMSNNINLIQHFHLWATNWYSFDSTCKILKSPFKIHTMH